MMAEDATPLVEARSAARSLPGGELGSAETGGKDAPSFEAATAKRPACVTDCANSPRHPPADAPWIMRLINMPRLLFKANLFAPLA